MATGNISHSTSAPDQETLKPRIDLATMFRLGLFQMGLGIMSLLTLGVLNRVMIEELRVPALIAAGAIAMHQFVSPTRIWFGQMSDSKPLWGHHRSGYVWIGAALFTAISFIAVQIVWQLGSSLKATGWSPTTYLWAGVLALAFGVYGLALSLSSTPFAALLVDVSDEDNRPKLVSIVWSMLMVGIIVGAIISSGLLKQITLDTPIEQLQASVNRLFVIVPAIVLVLCGIATVGVEKKYSRFGTRSNIGDRDDQIGLGEALRVLTASRQTGIFFTFLLVMSISLFMQDAVMEPYGGEVFGMPISETTQLNAFFGMGTLMGIAATGFLVVPRLGKQNTTKLGCICAAVCLGLIILAGFTEKPEMLMGSLLLYGLASGIITTGAISLMLDLTAAETAGTFIGAWGLAQAIARGLSTVSGGAVLDVGRFLFGTPVLSYALVFATQAAGMILAVFLLRRVNIHEFRQNAKDAIAAVMAGELD
ncbi:BCD family MFS transporter [Laspinema olomoucense]|uniref:BCD family MFS transporter n=1 Tax=Laspinema olomoucense D3b TaxID=2953688 RepID=A0ABT2N350_9CYAN|nr:MULTISPECIES: BCD family MFS transporter [unclassified Laspinema]MCT7974588.1 BCD family MFS transporter [Laspinema sp. D3d]MCT7977103.1 BCD family MFS transporter [Laspinema sp. D3b]MCT7987516.1 BCD family MFS transporter [Laspinema sp. D3a]MCT7993609.1 BCD family MFS transporter [Laspinema sp. D3c]